MKIVLYLLLWASQSCQVLSSIIRENNNDLSEEAERRYMARTSFVGNALEESSSSKAAVRQAAEFLALERHLETAASSHLRDSLMATHKEQNRHLSSAHTISQHAAEFSAAERRLRAPTPAAVHVTPPAPTLVAHNHKPHAAAQFLKEERMLANTGSPSGFDVSSTSPPSSIGGAPTAPGPGQNPDAFICPTPSSYETTYQKDNGSYGNLFKIQAKEKDLLIQSLDIHVQRTTWVDIRVWTRSGEIVTTDDGLWQSVYQGRLFGQGVGLRTSLGCFNRQIFVPANGTQSFFVAVNMTSAIAYSAGSLLGSVYESNSDLIFYEGYGVGEYSLGQSSTTTYSPRIWNGVIRYTAVTPEPATPACATTSSHETTFKDEIRANGNLFQIQAKEKDLSIQGLDIHTDLPPTSIQVRVWTRSGDLITTDDGKWVSVFEGEVTGQGIGNPTSLGCFSTAISVPAGSAQSFFVSLPSANMMYTNGTSLSSVFDSNDDLTVFEGYGVGSYSLGSSSTDVYEPRIWNGVVRYTTSIAGAGSPWDNTCGSNAPSNLNDFVYSGNVPSGASCQCILGNGDTLDSVQCTVPDVDTNGVVYDYTHILYFTDSGALQGAGTTLICDDSASSSCLDRGVLILAGSDGDLDGACLLVNASTGGTADGCTCNFCGTAGVTYQCDAFQSDGCEEGVFVTSPFVETLSDWDRSCGSQPASDLESFVYSGSPPSGASCTCSPGASGSSIDNVICIVPSVVVNGVTYEKSDILTFDSSTGKLQFASTILLCDEDSSDCTGVDDHAVIAVAGSDGDLDGSCLVVDPNNLDNGLASTCACTFCGNSGVSYSCDDFQSNGCQEGGYFTENPFKEPISGDDDDDDNDSGSGGGGSSSMIIIICAVVGAVVAGGFAAGFIFWRRSKKGKTPPPSPTTPSKSEEAEFEVGKDEPSGYVPNSTTIPIAQAQEVPVEHPPPYAPEVAPSAPFGETMETTTQQDTNNNNPTMTGINLTMMMQGELPPGMSESDLNAPPVAAAALQNESSYREYAPEDVAEEWLNNQNGLESFTVMAPPGALKLTMGERGPNGGHLVATVKSGSPLTGKVEVGDELTKLNSIDLTNMDGNQANDALRQSAGAARQLTLLRATQV